MELKPTIGYLNPSFKYKSYEWMFWDGKVWRESAFMVNRLASAVMKKYYEIAVEKIDNN